MQTEWDILQSYTRRIRCVLNFRRGLDKKSIGVLSNPPSTEPLFPNLRHLTCDYASIESTHLLHLPYPSLISLDVSFDDPHWFQGSLQSFVRCSPNIRNLALYVRRSDVAFDKLVSSCICRWRNLQTVFCPQISLDVDALVHLSRMPALTQLSFKQTLTLPDCGSPLLFSNMRNLTLLPASLGPISQLPSQTQLPAINEFTAIVDSRPSRQELSSFLDGVETSNSAHTVNSLSLYQSSLPRNVRSEHLSLGLADLQPCMEFSNLRHIHLDIAWSVGLTDSDLLASASAWPHLVRLEINPLWGWNTRVGGVTPNGLLRLLQTCRSLRRVALAIDTRGYVEPPLGGDDELKLPHRLCLDVLDSVIDAESVPAVAAFVAGIEPCPHLHAWGGSEMDRSPGWEVYRDRWGDVIGRVEDAVGRRS